MVFKIKLPVVIIFVFMMLSSCAPTPVGHDYQQVSLDYLDVGNHALVITREDGEVKIAKSLKA